MYSKQQYVMDLSQKFISEQPKNGTDTICSRRSCRAQAQDPCAMYSYDKYSRTNAQHRRPWSPWRGGRRALRGDECRRNNSTVRHHKLTEDTTWSTLGKNWNKTLNGMWIMKVEKLRCDVCWLETRTLSAPTWKCTTTETWESGEIATFLAPLTDESARLVH